MLPQRPLPAVNQDVRVSQAADVVRRVFNEVAPRDTGNLELHGRQWRVMVPVPRSLRKALGITRLKRGLKTDSLSVALAKRHSVIAELQKETAGRAARAAGDASSNPLWKEALEWQEAVKALT